MFSEQRKRYTTYNDGQSELTWTVEIQGKRLSLKRKGYTLAPQPPTPRGPITEFSRRARCRRLRRIAEVDWQRAGEGIFVTLTYPDDQANHTMEERKTHRYLINRHICREAGKHLGCFWRVEWMPRLTGKHVGVVMPHMHLLYLDCPPIDSEGVRRVWKRTIKANQHVQTDVRKVTKGDMVAVYVSKYCSKVSEPSLLDYVPKRNRTGRHAGELRRNLIPTHPLEIKERVEEGIVRFLRGRACDTLWWYDPRFDEGFTVLGDHALEMIRDLQDISLDKGQVIP